MRRKCCPQQCQSKLESSRNRYWEQEVNVSSWLRSSQQKLCRENKSSLTDSHSPTIPLFRAAARAFQAEHDSTYVVSPESVEHRKIITTLFLIGNMKACEYCSEATLNVTVNNRACECVLGVEGGAARLHHKCQDTADGVKNVQKKNTSKQHNQIKRHRTMSCGFPSFPMLKDDWQLEPRRKAGRVLVYSVFGLVGAARVVEAMMWIVDAFGAGQRSTWVLWPVWG